MHSLLNRLFGNNIKRVYMVLALGVVLGLGLICYGLKHNSTTAAPESTSYDTSVRVVRGYTQSDENTKIVRIACGVNKALYMDEYGRLAGYCAEYFQQLARVNNWNLVYVNGSWGESVKNLEEGRIDILFPTQKIPGREKTMFFSSMMGGYQPVGLYANRDAAYYYDDYASFNGAKIAVSEASSNEEALKAFAAAHHFTYTPVYLNSTSDKVSALLNGSVDLIVFSTINTVVNGKIVAMLDYLPFYYTTNINNPTLAKELDHGMNILAVQSPKLASQVYSNFLNKDVEVAETRAEHEAVKANNKLVIGAYKDTSPLFDEDDQGNPYGVYVDLIKEIKESTGLDIEIKTLERDGYVLDALKEGKVDYVIGSSGQALSVSSAFGKDFFLSSPIMDYYTVHISKPDFKLEKNSAATFALTSGRKYWTNLLVSIYPNAKFTYYKTPKDCLSAVQDGSADVTLLNTWEFNYESKNDRFSDLMEWESSRDKSSTVMVTTPKVNPLIRSVVDKAIIQISEERKTEIIASNLNRPYTNYNLLDRYYAVRVWVLIFAIILLAIFAGMAFYVRLRRKTTNILRAKNKELQDSNQRLEEANGAKDKFLSRMSHELRTPLNAITGYTTELQENLQAKELNRKAFEENLEAIQRASGYQLALIGDLLDIQKIAEGRLEMIPTIVDPKAFIEDILKMVEPEAKAKNIAFTYESSSAFNEAYLTDGIRIKQVLTNVLHNAIKFTPEGGKVSFTSQVIDKSPVTSTLKFTVADNGIGMSKHFVDNYLFHKFAQEFSDNKSPYEGCGLGLAISRELLHLMGGEISCYSEPGVGTTFTIILTVENIKTKAPRRSRLQHLEQDLKGLRILICEDNQMNMQIETRLLEKLGAQVEGAENGKLGCDAFESSAPGYYDAILMDIRMPVMDGLEAARYIRSLNRPEAKTIPILAVSANAFPEDVRNSLAAGINEHLSKPMDIRLIRDRIKKYCKLE